MMDRTHLLVEADELASLILETPEVQTYQVAKMNLDNHPEAMSLLRRFRELREQVAEFQARRVPPMHYSYILEETDQLMGKLEKIPEVTAFEEAQAKMDALLDAVTSRLSAAVLQNAKDSN